MDKLKALIEASIEDNFLSKEEEHEILVSLSSQYVSPKQRVNLINYAVAKAAERANPDNEQYVFKWLKKVSHVLGDFGTDEFHNNAYFSHTDDLRAQVIDNLEAAKFQLNISLFTISDNDISKSIVHAHNRGLKVQVVTDDEKIMDKGSDIFQLKHSGIPIKIDTASSLMHHKFVVIDNSKVLTGSYNWTRTASELNNENILITDNARIVNAFELEFTRLWEQMKPL